MKRLEIDFAMRVNYFACIEWAYVGSVSYTFAFCCFIMPCDASSGQLYIHRYIHTYYYYIHTDHTKNIQLGCLLFVVNSNLTRIGRSIFSNQLKLKVNFFCLGRKILPRSKFFALVETFCQGQIFSLKPKQLV
jgi:hypothetical protein